MSTGGNRWFPWVGYQPANRRTSWSSRSSTSASVANHGATAYGSGTVDPSQKGVPSEFHANSASKDSISPSATSGNSGSGGYSHSYRTALVNGLAASIPQILVTIFLLSSMPKPLSVEVPPTRDREVSLFAVKLERASSEKDLLRVVRKKAPAAEHTVVPVWNYGNEHHVVFGHRPTIKKPFFTPVPRPHSEESFVKLEQRRLMELWLYEIQVSGSLTPEAFEGHVYKWASHCGVQKEWIDYWSSWRSPTQDTPAVGPTSRLAFWFHESTHLVNECRPGGTCFIVAYECDAQALQDFSSVSDNSAKQE